MVANVSKVLVDLPFLGQFYDLMSFLCLWYCYNFLLFPIIPQLSLVATVAGIQQKLHNLTFMNSISFDSVTLSVLCMLVSLTGILLSL